jgi:hypothetical protein
LISPAYFEEYARVLKWVLPLVGVVVMAIGMIVGAFDAMKANAVGLADLFSGVLIKGLSMGISATFQALIWTTAGFVIAERAGARESGKAPEWKIEDLPEVQSDEKGKIPLSDSITELVVTVVFSILVILLCVGLVPYAFYFQNGDIQAGSVFSSTFLASCVPAVAIMALFGVAECVIKIQARRWTPLVCAAVVAHSLVGMGIVVYLLSRGDLFSVEFAAFLQSLDLGGPDWLHLVQVDGTNPLILLACTIVVVLSLVECGKAVYKTIKYK